MLPAACGSDEFLSSKQHFRRTGSAAERLHTWTSVSKPDSQPLGLLAKSLVAAEVTAALPAILGPQFLSDQRLDKPVSRDLALYAGIQLLRKLGVYNGSVVEVTNPASRRPTKQLTRIYAIRSSAGAASRPSTPGLQEEQLSSSPRSAISQGTQHLPPLHLGSVYVEAAAAFKPARHPAADSQGNKSWVLSQPGRASAVVPVATSVSLTKVRVPEVALFSHRPPKPAAEAQQGGGLDDRDKGDEATSLSAINAAADEAADISSALAQHLQEQRHIVAQGSIIAVPRHTLPQQDGLLQILYGGAQHAHMPLQLLFFQVTRLEPSGAGPLGLDPAQTTVSLQGTCNASLPVGLQHYAASVHHALQASGAAASTATNSTDQDGPLAALSASSPSEDVLKDRRASHALAGAVGWDAAASSCLHARLPGIGTLMPAWRQVAKILAPVFHEGAAGVSMRVALLVHGPAGCGKATAVRAAAAAMGLHVIPFGCAGLHGGDGQGDKRLRKAHEAACSFAPAVLLLTWLEMLAGRADEAASNPGSREGETARLVRAVSELSRMPASPLDPEQAGSSSRHRVIIVACCRSIADVPAILRRCFTHELLIDAPEASERTQLLEGMLGAKATSRLGSVVKDLAAQTAGLMPRDLAGLVADAGIAAVMQGVDAYDYISKPEAATSAWQQPAAITQQHLLDALARLRKRTATAIGAPQVPDVRWEDVGGLEGIKEAILETVELPLRHPHLFASGFRRRSGILLYGPPGTGKTLVAKACATECGINFLAVKGPELINMYIGESERQVREIFARARSAAPCILFFDELDSLAPARGAGADSGGVMDRVVAQLLAEMDGAQSVPEGSSGRGGASNDVFVIGATNRPDLLDSALMRPGRLDRLLYVGIAEDPSTKLSVLAALTRKFRLAPDVDLRAVARECVVTFTGADLYALAADAWLTGLKRTVADCAADDADEVEVCQADFLKALKELKPSLSSAELQRFEALRLKFEHRK